MIGTRAGFVLDAARVPIKAVACRRNHGYTHSSVGDNRHYLDTVMPRHFVESAEKVGIPGSVVREQLKELADLAPRAIESVPKSLPSGFKRDISSSIVRGVERRLTLT
jgi:serine/threonine-protein kinase HipA